MEQQKSEQICDQCGQCCIQFAGQIYYQIEELERISIQEVDNSLFHWFFNNRDRFKEAKFQKEVIFVPSWKNILDIIPFDLKTQYYNPKISPDACIFLSFENNKKAECRIHPIKSQICQRYPQFKGNACIQHPERRFSLAFFEFQCNRSKIHRKFLQDLYGLYLSDPHALDLFIFLLDHDRFIKSDVYRFVSEYWNVDTIRFNQILQQLEKIGIVKQIDINSTQMLEAITTDDLKIIAEKILRDETSLGQ